MISKRGLMKLIKGLDAAAKKELTAWLKIAQGVAWRSMEDVHAVFPEADRVGKVIVFNIRHNEYRLMVREVFDVQRLYVKAVLTHKQYDKGEWKKWAKDKAS